MPDIIDIPLDAIDASRRLRPVDPDHAAMIAESFAASGQMVPIEVRSAGANAYALIAGAHRLAAAHLAGLPTIRATVVEADDDQAELREIDENLCRHELTALDRSVFLAKRKALWLKLHPETGRGGDRKSRKNQNDNSVVLFPAFTEATAAKLGVSRKSIERAVWCFEKLDPQARAQLAGTVFARRASELVALCRHDATRQRRIVALMTREKEPLQSVAAANAQLSGTKAAKPSPEEQRLQRLVALFDGASAKVQRRFVDHLVAQGHLQALRAGAAA